MLIQHCPSGAPVGPGTTQSNVYAAHPCVEPQSAQHAAAEPEAFQVAIPGYSQPSAHTALAAGGGGGGSSGFGMQVSRMPSEG